MAFVRFVDNPPGKRWEKRVFIGGDYEMYSRLLDIREVILEEGFVPILAREFYMPEELIRHHTLLLLHNCRLAVFEVSKDAGQLAEIERLSDYENVPLFLFDAAKAAPAISAMVSSHRLFKDYSRCYTDTDELRRLVKEFLKANA